GLVGPAHDRLQQLIHAVAAEHAWPIIRLAIPPAHVHLVIRANPSTPPSDSPRLMKGRSSRCLREEFPQLKKLPSPWTHAFFLSTAGTVSRALIQKYIERQPRT